MSYTRLVHVILLPHISDNYRKTWCGLNAVSGKLYDARPRQVPNPPQDAQPVTCLRCLACAP